MWRSCLLAVAAALAAASAVAADYDVFESGAWKGIAYHSDKTGEFVHCAMSTQYKSGIVFVYGLKKDRTLDVVLGAAEWNMNPGDQYPVTVLIDGAEFGHYSAQAFTKRALKIRFGDGHAFFAALRRGTQLTIKMPERDLRFDLAGTPAALQRLEQCVDDGTHAAGGGATPSMPGAGGNPSKPKP